MGDEVSSRHSAVIKRAGGNTSWLAASAGFSAIASLIYVALVARTLGPRAFGGFVLVMTYGELMTDLVQFQSWKAVTSFGAAHYEARSAARLRRLFGYTTTIDWASAVLGAVLAVTIVPFIGPLLHWSGYERSEAALFSAALLLTLSTTPAGILRILDRFDLQVLSDSAVQVIRLAGCIVGWALGAGVAWFLCVWAFASLALQLLQWGAVLSLGYRPSLGRHALRQAEQENRGLWSFMVKTNLSGSLSLFWMQSATLVVGAGAGAVQAGGFRLAYRFSQAMMKPVEIATKALFPELARLVAENDHSTMRSVILRVAAISALFALLIVGAAGLFGADVLRLVAGPGYEFAYGFLFLLSIASALNVVGFVLEPLHNAHLRAGTVLRSYAVATLIYLLLVIALFPVFGPDGIAFASIAAALAINLQLASSAVRILNRKGPKFEDEAEKLQVEVRASLLAE
jgi:O-antigen/teichoic acid export membrane protein